VNIDLNKTDWLLLDTETTGLSAPIFVVELAAQRMHGWEPDGEPFRRLLNQNADVPPEATRVHGYTRQVLERDGDPPASVYRDFSLYVGGRPLVSYNLEYDLDEVLKPEWLRLGIEPIGTSTPGSGITPAPWLRRPARREPRRRQFHQ
jgi:DNA polymerase-3 subunit epsilon